MTDLAALGLSVTSDGVVKATGDLDRFKGASDRAAGGADNLGKRSDVVQGSLRRLASVAGTLVGALAAAFSLGAAARGAAEVQAITNGFLGMGQTADQAAASLAAVAEIANQTRAPLTATAELYRRVSTAAGELGASQAEVQQFTKNIGQALAASGTSAEQASGALLQLSQAMAGGTVRAEEFNSILEGAFPIAQAAARGIAEAGGSVGRLRQLVVAGKVSSEEFFRAILSQSASIEAAFGRTVPTVSQAMTVFNNAVGLSAAGIDKALGVSSGLATVIMGLASVVLAAGDAFVTINEAIGGFQGYIIAGAAALVGAYIPAIWAAISATAVWIAGLITLRGALIMTGIGALVVLAGALINMFIKLIENTGGWGNALTLLGEVAAGVWEGIKTSASSIGPALGSVWETVKSGFYSMLAGISRRWESFLLGMAGAAANVPGLDTVSGELFGAAAATSAGTAGFESASDAAAARAAELSGEASRRIATGFDAAKEAANKLMDAVSGTGDAITEITPPTVAATAAMDNLGKTAGGAAKKGIDEVAKAAKEAQKRMDDWANNMAGHFDGLITGGKNLSGVLQSMARQLESTGWQMLFRGLSRGIFGGGGGGGFLGSLFAGFFDQGGMIPAGQVGIVGERGPEFVRGPAVVTSRADTARAMAGGAAGGVIDVVLHVPEGVTVQQATAIAGSVAVRVTQGGLAQNRQALPRQIDQLNARGR
jgi:tape measure domain-containing protein